MHYHGYATRVPGPLANGNAESHPEHPMFRISKVPPRANVHWLKRDQTKVGGKVFDTPEAAAAWHAAWIEENPRPDSYWASGTPESRAEFTRTELAHGSARVDGFYTAGGEFVSATFVPCPSVAACPVR